jgi:hypothetical protein
VSTSLFVPGDPGFDDIPHAAPNAVSTVSFRPGGRVGAV